tara:strand:+ start:2980 stop:3174 length:195 start_codon:yes stop_codon:yes gene_type:complete
LRLLARWFRSAPSYRASYNRLWRLYKGDILIKGGENTDKADIVLQRARREGAMSKNSDNNHVWR